MSGQVQGLCIGKATYTSWALAEKIARRDREKKRGNLKPYRCRLCGAFHVGNANTAKRIRRWSKRS